MVLRQSDLKMANEQPVKKKLRREDEEHTADEPDYIHNLNENGSRADLSALRLSLPDNVNEDDLTLNTLNTHLSASVKSPLRTSEQTNSDRTSFNQNVTLMWDTNNSGRNGVYIGDVSKLGLSHNTLNTYIAHPNNTSIQPAPDIFSSSSFAQPFLNTFTSTNLTTEEQKPSYTSNFYGQTSQELTNHNRHHSSSISTPKNMQQLIVQEYASSSNLSNQISQEQSRFVSNVTLTGHSEYSELTETNLEESSLDVFQNHLIKQCLCAISERTLRKPFEGQQITDSNGTRTAMLCEWPTNKILEFLSKLQLLFDVYLKQNNSGYICSRIVNICDMIVRNEYNLIEQIISLCDMGNKYMSFLSAKVLSSFLIIAKTNINNEWLETMFNFLTMETIDYVKMNFALEIIKRVVEWKDVEIHVLEESQTSHDGASGSTAQQTDNTCTTITYSDSDSYDTSAIKGLIIKGLESKWPELINRIQYLISHNDCVESQTCILTFLALWESTISVKANLSVIDTKPFYTHLEVFVGLLHSSLPPIIWKQLLSLFNEVLCYGSTLALQDMLPDDTCQLAHLVVRYVKDFRLLDCLPFRRNEGFTVHSFVGTIASSQSTQTNIDKTLLQKLVLLVLKSVAITIKETRSDSSDSSVGSDDYDFYQDMQLIERSIRDVLKKVDVFIKNSLDFHPETPFSKILIHLFSDQDDYMIESMVCTLDITIGISYRNAVFPDLISMLNPVLSFIEFLRIVSHDSDILLDYLINNETCFLLYLLRFLKYIRRNWSKFVNSCCDSSATSRDNELDNTMTVLIRLKMQINRLVAGNLFPYNINPVLRLLEVCEGLYEGNEYS